MNIIINLISEALFVGFYVLLLYVILRFLLPIKMLPIELLYFYVGFYKHLLAYYIGIHDYYCRNGYACQKISSKSLGAQGQYIILDSIFEGILFIIVCKIAMFRKINEYVNIFVIGFTIHILAEIIHIHKIFCTYRCI